MNATARDFYQEAADFSAHHLNGPTAGAVINHYRAVYGLGGADASESPYKRYIAENAAAIARVKTALKMATEEKRLFSEAPQERLLQLRDRYDGRSHVKRDSELLRQEEYRIEREIEGLNTKLNSLEDIQRRDVQAESYVLVRFGCSLSPTSEDRDQINDTVYKLYILPVETAAALKTLQKQQEEHQRETLALEFEAIYESTRTFVRTPKSLSQPRAFYKRCCDTLVEHERYEQGFVEPGTKKPSYLDTEYQQVFENLDSRRTAMLDKISGLRSQLSMLDEENPFDRTRLEADLSKRLKVLVANLKRFDGECVVLKQAVDYVWLKFGNTQRFNEISPYEVLRQQIAFSPTRHLAEREAIHRPLDKLSMEQLALITRFDKALGSIEKNASKSEWGRYLHEACKDALLANIIKMNVGDLAEVHRGYVAEAYQEQLKQETELKEKHQHQQQAMLELLASDRGEQWVDDNRDSLLRLPEMKPCRDSRYEPSVRQLLRVYSDSLKSEITALEAEVAQNRSILALFQEIPEYVKAKYATSAELKALAAAEMTMPKRSGLRI